MAGTITHLVFAQTTPTVTDSFLAANVFVDINHLRVVPREYTHISSIATIKRDTERITQGLCLPKEVTHDFLLGAIYHSVVDALWAGDIWVESKSKLFGKALKFWYDEFLWDKMQTPETITTLLKRYRNCQIFKNVPLPEQNRWAQIMLQYLSKKPNSTTRQQLIYDLSLPKEVADEIESIINTSLRNNAELDYQLLQNLKHIPQRAFKYVHGKITH